MTRRRTPFRARLTATERLEIRAQVETGKYFSRKAIARRFRCSPGTVAAIATGTRYALSGAQELALKAIDYSRLPF